jgi:hypothetical protein
VEKFCDEVLWLDSGRIRGEGDPRRVVSAYITDVAKTEEKNLATSDARARERAAQSGTAEAGAAPDGAPAAAEPPADMFKSTEGRWGSREVEIVDVRLLGADGTARHVFQSGEPATIELKVRAHDTIESCVFGIGIFNGDGVCCYGTNTDIEEFEIADFNGEQTLAFRVKSLDMVEGTYQLDVAAHRVDGYPYDYHRLLYSFRVKSRTKDVGIYRPPHEWTFTAGMSIKDVREPK